MSNLDPALDHANFALSREYSLNRFTQLICIPYPSGNGYFLWKFNKINDVTLKPLCDIGKKLAHNEASVADENGSEPLSIMASDVSFSCDYFCLDFGVFAVNEQYADFHLRKKYNLR